MIDGIGPLLFFSNTSRDILEKLLMTGMMMIVWSTIWQKMMNTEDATDLKFYTSQLIKSIDSVY